MRGFDTIRYMPLQTIDDVIAALDAIIQRAWEEKSRLGWWSYVIGYRPTLHVTGRTHFDPPPATFQNSNIGGLTSVTFTAHIDTSFA